MLTKREKRIRRHARVTSKAQGTASLPRLCVFRSNKSIYCQIIDDENGCVLFSANDFAFKKNKAKKDKQDNKLSLAFEVGKAIAEKSLEKKIKKVVFDRGGYKYHGRVKALAEGARQGGLSF
jgi:large subunit ribosomal protein L18